MNRTWTTEQQREPCDILVLEDDPALRQLLLEELEEAGHNCAGLGDLAAARELLEEQMPKLVISDLHLPDGKGLELLEELRQGPVTPSVIVITAFGTIDQAVDALKRGADDFLTKPLDLEHLSLSVTRTLQRQQLEQDLSYYRRLLDQGEFHGMIGRSPQMRQLFTQIQQVAQADAPVLITGESGVGKELVARALHRESQRSQGPFVAINCGGIAPNLLESELFGHSAGAFTGATKARRGLFAAAHGGTLMLDEIGEMPMEMQASLLRILQDGRVRPVGSNSEQALDVRIVAATNRELPEDVAEGRFREDLYYRLETFALEVPPLRQRGDDLERLIAHLIHQFNQRRQQPVDGLTDEALALLKQYSFPGNVRELANIMERAITFCTASHIGPEQLPPRVRDNRESAPAQANSAWLAPTESGQLQPLEVIERSYIRYVLDQMDGNKRRAAEILNIGRRTLYRWLETDV